MAHDSNDFEALARQYWGMWSDAARTATPGASGFGSIGSMGGLQGFRDAMDVWTRSVGGSSGGSGGNDALGHFNRQSQHWYGQMQQVAAQFAGQNHNARDVAEAWRKLIGGNGSELFQTLFDGMQGPGMQQLQQWSDAAAPWLQSMHKEAATTLGMPTFGFAREHQERLQGLARTQLDWQQALSGYHALLGKVSQDAFSRFESKLIDREEPGRQIGSVRALFDLWVDAAEEAYAESALSLEYRHAYGTLVNAQMRLRNAMQSIMEQNATSAGLPGRAELDSAHRKIAELERLVRRIERGAEAGDIESSSPRRGGPMKQATKNKRIVQPAVKAKPAAKKSANSTAKKQATPVKPARKAAPTTRRKR